MILPHRLTQYSVAFRFEVPIDKYSNLTSYFVYSVALEKDRVF